MSSALILKEPKAKVSIKSYWLTLGELRLDASFYTEDSQRAIRILEENGYELTDINTLSACVFNPPPIKRYYSDNKGTPYLMPMELFFLRLKPTKFVFTSKMANIQDWFVKNKWIILTQSGKAGVPLYVTSSLEKFVISQNAIRIVPKDDVCPGFLYAYLSTWLGKALVTKDQFGVTVEHIRPHHVESVKVPILPKEIQRIVHENIAKVFSIRDKARFLLEESENMLLGELGLPKIEKVNESKSFSVDSSKLELRFDASYHVPLVENIKLKLAEGKYKSEKLDNNVIRVFLPDRFKRVYVQREYGVPFLSGADIVQIKRYDLKYLSKKVTAKLEDCLVQEGWILVTRSGTVGRVALVPSKWTGWAITEDVIRVISNPEKLHRGFLTAFLQSEYGYQQTVSKIFGGVVDHITEDNVRDIMVPIPSMDVQKKIGDLVVEAYEIEELANKIEDETIQTLENMLEKTKKIEVNEEYLKEINAYVDSFELIADEDFHKSREELETGDTTSLEEFKKEHGL